MKLQQELQEQQVVEQEHLLQQQLIQQQQLLQKQQIEQQQLLQKELQYLNMCIQQSVKGGEPNISELATNMETNLASIIGSSTLVSFLPSCFVALDQITLSG